jgi:hypothetical protein
MRTTAVSYSQKLAPRMDAKKPFTDEFLDRVREQPNRAIAPSRKLKR